MIIEEELIIDNILRTITVSNLIDETSDVWVMVNGVIGLTVEDISISGNTITIPEIEPIDFLGDKLIVMYNEG